jgi:iron(III) transport system permease protein
MLYLLVRSLEIGVTEVQEVVFSERSIGLLLNSGLLVIAVTFTAMLIGFFQAWLIIRSDLPFKKFFTFLAVLPFAIPSYVAALTWLTNFPSVRGFVPAWIILSLLTSPYVYLAASAALLSQSSKQEEVARTLGFNAFQVLRRITWPNVRGAVFAGGLISALYTLSDFGAVSLVKYDTFTRAIYIAYRSSFDRNVAAALSLILVIVAVMLYLTYRYFTNTENPTSSSQFSSLTKLGKLKVPSLLSLGILATLSFSLPLVSLIRWQSRGQSVADTAQILRATINTFSYALLGGLVIALLSFASAIVIGRFQSRFTQSLQRLLWITHSLPGLVVALSLIHLSNRYFTISYQTSFLVILAYVILFLPNSFAVLKRPIEKSARALEEVAQSMGYTYRSLISRLLIPMFKKPLLITTALATLTIVKELPATLLLRPTGIETLATRLWSATSGTEYAEASTYALIILLLAGIPTVLLTLAQLPRSSTTITSRVSPKELQR